MVFQCSRYPFRGNKKHCISHFIVKLAPTDQVPFLCKTCNCKTVSLGKWQRHIRNDVKKPYLNKEHVCIKSVNPFTITVGNDNDIYEVMKEINNTCSIDTQSQLQNLHVVEKEGIIEEVEEYILEVQVDPREENIVELGSRMEEMKSQHEKEMRELEEKHKFECLRFENFIERLEKRKQELTREIQKLTGKLKRKEEDDDDFDHKKIRSVVIPKPKCHLDF